MIVFLLGTSIGGVAETIVTVGNQFSTFTISTGEPVFRQGPTYIPVFFTMGCIYLHGWFICPSSHNYGSEERPYSKGIDGLGGTHSPLP